MGARRAPAGGADQRPHGGVGVALRVAALGDEHDRVGAADGIGDRDGVVERLHGAHGVAAAAGDRGDKPTGAAVGAGGDDQSHRGSSATSTRRIALPATRRSRSACMA